MTKYAGPAIESFEVEGLLGRRHHNVQFSSGSPVTLIAGPNGAGKTHLLKLLRATLALDISALLSIPYTALRLGTSKSRIEVQREDDEDEHRLKFKMFDTGGAELGSFSADSSQFTEDESADLPPWIVRVEGDRWYDDRSGRYVPTRVLERKYGVALGSDRNRAQIVDANPWLGPFITAYNPILIDTRRLDSAPVRAGSSRTSFGQPMSQAGGTAARIVEYVEQVQAQISEARRESLRRSQVADQNFAANLLKKSRDTVNKADLERRFAEFESLNAELSRNSLAARAAAVKLPEKPNPTEKRALDLFLRDWRQKMEPLGPIHQKLTTLKRIVNEKFADKTLGVTPGGTLEFIGDAGEPLSVHQLSSGEQHLLALFALLLFSANDGSVVLIDEPEISLHAAWKHAFITDIEEVAKLSKLQLIMATHSTGLINGRWDLTQELTL